MLKTKLIFFVCYKTRAQARLSIFDYVESFYNRVRLQERLGYNSPEDYEKLRFSA
jgi:putative transposase